MAASLALVAGCAGSGPRLPDGAGPPTTLATPGVEVTGVDEAATDPALASFYSQDVDWSDCAEARECAGVTVPLDWGVPSGPTIEIAVVRRPASGERIGSLLVNPGGPGASGFDLVGRHGDQLTSEQVRERYDLVGFDPRGVGRSAPLDCIPDRELDRRRGFDPKADLEADEAAAVAEMAVTARRFAAACATDAGPLLAHLDTLSGARDLDVLRAAVGDERLTYLGYSYGTLLGALYAQEFPQRVGRLVLDGAIDPASSDGDVVLGQAVGMESALRAYATACLAGDTSDDCPLRGSVDEAMQQVADVLERADDSPLRAQGGREVTGGLAFTGVIAPLYDDASWPELDGALAAALGGDGTGLLVLADRYSDREPDGSYSSNIEEVFAAVNCLDYPVDDSPEAMRAAAEELEEAAPLLGGFMSYGEVQCGQWLVPAARTPAPVRAAGAPPILVIGTTGDPATPYAWAEALAGQLESGRLLTYEGEGHTAFGRGSRCVDDAVDAYLLDGVLVGEGAVCG